jgi:S1-C subfamily serine protease
MLHPDPDTNNNNIREDATVPYQPVPQSPRVVPDDSYRGWTNPNQYVQSGSGQRLGENYGPSAFPAQEDAAQRPVQTNQSGHLTYPAVDDPRLGFNNTQLRQPPVWSSPLPPNVSNQPPYVPPSYNNANRPPSGSRGWRAGAIIAMTLVLLLVFGVGLFAGWVFTQNGIGSNTNTLSGLQTNSNSKATVPAITNNSSNLDAVREAVISKVEPAVVQINVTTSSGNALGSGVIIDKRGYVVTNNHVVAGSQSIQVVLADNSKYTAQITGTDATDDLAVVKISAPTNLITATLGDSSKLLVGQEVLAIGNPLGITQTVTRGIISALNRTVNEGQSSSGGSGPATIIPSAIQTDAPINPGNSGGALVDLQGNVIGIPTLAAVDPEFNQTANGVGFAIPSNRVSFIAQQLIQYGKVIHSGRAAMGISAEEVNANVASMAQLAVDHGVLIDSVVAGGPAQNAGLKANDVIVQIDNTQINTLSDLQDALLSKNPGDHISVKVYRGSQQLTITLTLTELQISSS